MFEELHEYMPDPLFAAYKRLLYFQTLVDEYLAKDAAYQPLLIRSITPILSALML